MFLVRDNLIFLIDTVTKKVVKKIVSKQRLVGLYKLKDTKEDAMGYKINNYRIIFLTKVGGIIVLFQETENDPLQSSWQKIEIPQTAIYQNKEIVINAFSNKYS